MIRFFRALAWLRWRLLWNGLRPPRRNDALERVSRVFHVIVPLLFILLCIPGALVLGLLGFGGGWILGASPAQRTQVFITLRILLGFACIAMLLAPLLRAVQGSPPNLPRFLLLPIPPRALYLCEAFASLADPWLAILLPGIFLLPIGMLFAGRPAAAALALAAGGVLLALFTGLGALSSSFALLMFRNRRRGELLSVLLIVLISGASILPGLLTTLGPDDHRPRTTTPRGKSQPAERRGRPGTTERPGEILPVWALAYPPELYVRALGLSAEGRSGAGLIPLTLLALASAGFHVLSWKTYRRLLDTPEVAGGPRRTEKLRIRWLKIPGLGPPAAAVALAHVRLAQRTVQGKISFWLTPVMVLAFGAILGRQLEEAMGKNPLLSPGILLASSGVLFSLLTLEGVILNQFAVDRAGLTLQFLSPLSDRDLLMGKALGGAVLAGGRALLCFLAAALVIPGGSLLLWLAVPLTGIAIYSLLAPVGAILSVVFPKTSDLNRIGQAGKPHPVASLLGFLVILFGAGPAAGVVLVAVLLLKSPALALLLVGAWTALAAGLSIPLYRLAEGLLARRRENLALVAQGR